MRPCTSIGGAAAPAKMSPRVQVSVCAPGAPLIEQPAVLVCQFTPPPAGSGSVSTTAVAVPSPLLLTTMVNVAVSPALIVCPSGVLTIARPGPVTVVVSDPEAKPVLPDRGIREQDTRPSWFVCMPGLALYILRGHLQHCHVEKDPACGTLEGASTEDARTKHHVRVRDKLDLTCRAVRRAEHEGVNGRTAKTTTGGERIRGRVRDSENPGIHVRKPSKPPLTPRTTA